MNTETERQLKADINTKRKELLDYYKDNKIHVMRDGTKIYVSQLQLDVWREYDERSF